MKIKKQKTKKFFMTRKIKFEDLKTLVANQL